MRTTSDGHPIHSRVDAAAADVELGNDPTEWDAEIDAHPREVWIEDEECWARCITRNSWMFVEGPPPSEAYVRAKAAFESE